MGTELQQAVEIYDLIVTFLVTYSFQIIGAIITLLIGIFIARKAAGLVLGFLLKRNIDISLSRFTASTVRTILIVMIVIMALGQVGISITPFVAAVGALSLGAGLAAQGLLSNYGAGISIIVTRPFVVGDTISVKGVTGIVKEISLGYTILSNEDEIRITIPNRHIIGEIIHNSQKDTILDLNVGIAYHCDPQQAVAVIKAALQGLPGVSEQREPQLGIDRFGDSSIDIGIRCWVKTELLYQTRYRVNQAIHQALAANDIQIPFPQRDVHLIAQTPTAG